jgi:hypothetical protein
MESCIPDDINIIIQFYTTLPILLPLPLPLPRYKIEIKNR